MIGIVIPLLGTVVTLLAASERDSVSQPPAPTVTGPGVSEPAPGTQSPTVDPIAPAPSPSPSSAEASATPEGTPDLTAPAGYKAHQGRWGVAPTRCDEQQFTDLDTGVSTTLKVTGGTPSPAARTAGAELEYRADTEWPCTDNGTQPIAMELRSATGSHVGMIREGQPRTFENCRAAAGTGFGPMSFFGSGEETRGFVRGAAVCSVTDQGSVAMALIDDLSNEDTPVAGGRLIVWTKS